MRDFSWNLFAATGDIEAYLLFREYQSIVSLGEVSEEEEKEEES